MQLRLAITDLYGNVVARLDRFSQAEVTIPWNDSRTAKVTLNVQDGAASQVLVLERMLKVWLAQDDGTADLVFWGPILAPTWTLHDDTVEVAAHDISIRLKHHYLTAHDAAVTTPGRAPDDYKGSVPVSATGLRRLRDAGKNTASENGAGVPDLGIINGSNTHPGAARDFAQTTTLGSQSYPAATLKVADSTLFPDGGGTIYLGATLGGPPTYTISGASQTLTYTSKNTGGGQLKGVDGWSGSGTVSAGTSVIAGGGEARRMLTERGECVWDKFQELAQLPTGPDFELEPYDGASPVAANGLNESTDVPQTVATAGSVGLRASSDIVVTDPGHVETMHVSVWLERDHTLDVTLILVAPDGRNLTLVERTDQTVEGADYGTGSAGASRTDFDDSATTAIEDGSPPYVGFFVPHQDLAGLRDMLAAGTWTLQVYAGSLASAAGTLHNWAINFIPDTAPPPTPPYARLNTFDKEDVSPGGPKDKRSSAVFVFGFARQNVEELTYSPGGDSVRNRVTAVTANTGGDGDILAGTGATQVQRRSNFDSRHRYGNYEQWEAAGSLAKAASPSNALGDIAEYWLESLAFPPQQLEIKPATAPAGGGLPGLLRYMREFIVGDLVRVAARWGNVSLLDPTTGAATGLVDVIIREVALSQKDDAGNLDTKVTCVPFVPAPPVVEDPSA